MDDLITAYVLNTYSPEAQEDIFQALGLFQVFNYLDPYKEFADLLSMESYVDTTVMADNFTSIILVAQQFILDRHGVALTEETTLAFNNSILRVLFRLLKLEDPRPVLLILEDQIDNASKFAEIVELLGSIPFTTTMQLIEQVRPVFTKLLSEYLYTQESNLVEARDDLPGIKADIVLFTEVYGINEAIRLILDSDAIMGEPFQLYLPLFQQLRESVADEKILVETLLFLLLYSSDGNMDPVIVFEKYSDYLVPDLNTGYRLKSTLSSMYMAMTRHKEKQAHEEK